MVKEFHCELRIDYDLAAILPDGWLQEGILVVLGSLVAYSKELLYASESVDIKPDGSRFCGSTGLTRSANMVFKSATVRMAIGVVSV